MEWKEGDLVTFDTENERMVVQKVEEEKDFTPEFLNLVKDICDQNDELLKELVNR